MKISMNVLSWNDFLMKKKPTKKGKEDAQALIRIVSSNGEKFTLLVDETDSGSVMLSFIDKAEHNAINITAGMGFTEPIEHISHNSGDWGTIATGSLRAIISNNKNISKFFKKMHKMRDLSPKPIKGFITRIIFMMEEVFYSEPLVENLCDLSMVDKFFIKDGNKFVQYPTKEVIEGVNQ